MSGGGPDDFEEVPTSVTGAEGQDAPTAQHADVGIVAELQAMLTKGDVKTLALYTLADEFVVGRGSACDWQLDDNSLSRRHATFAWDGKKLSVEDLGSANGTRIDGRAIATRTPVPTGATVHLGTVAIRLTESSIVSRASVADPDSESTRTVPIAQIERSARSQRPAAAPPKPTAQDARSTAASMPAVPPAHSPSAQRPSSPAAPAARPPSPAAPAARPPSPAAPAARAPSPAVPAARAPSPAVPAAAPSPPVPAAAPPSAAAMQYSPAASQQSTAASQQPPSAPAGGRSFAPANVAQLETRLTGGVHPKERADARGVKVFRPPAHVAGPDEQTATWDPRVALQKENEKPLETTRLVEGIKRQWKTNRRPFVLAGAVVWVAGLLGMLYLHEKREQAEQEEDEQVIAPVLHDGQRPRPPKPVVDEPLPAVTQLSADGGAAAPSLPDGGGPPPLDRENVLADAIAAYDQGKVDEALQGFRRLADDNPRDHAARYMVDLLEELAAKGKK